MEYTVNNRWDRVYDPRWIIRIIERHNRKQMSSITSEFIFQFCDVKNATA